jgi:hypothetical protein
MSRFMASVGFSPTRWNGAMKIPNFMRWGWYIELSSASRGPLKY